MSYLAAKCQKESKNINFIWGGNSFAFAFHMTGGYICNNHEKNALVASRSSGWDNKRKSGPIFSLQKLTLSFNKVQGKNVMVLPTWFGKRNPPGYYL